MNHWAALGAVWNYLQTAILAVLGYAFVRFKTDEMGRDALQKSLDRLRDEIGDRDRLGIAQRDQIAALTGRIELISAEVARKESQVAALLEENLNLKQELRRLRGK